MLEISNHIKGDDIRRLTELLSEKHMARNMDNIFEIFVALEHAGNISSTDLSLLETFALKTNNQSVLDILSRHSPETGI